MGEGKIFRRDRVTGVVSRQAEMHRAITDIDVGMMIGGLGQLADFDDQRQGLDKIGARDGAGQGVVRLGPAHRGTSWGIRSR